MKIEKLKIIIEIIIENNPEKYKLIENNKSSKSSNSNKNSSTNSSSTNSSSTNSSSTKSSNSKQNSLTNSSSTKSSNSNQNSSQKSSSNSPVSLQKLITNHIGDISYNNIEDIIAEFNKVHDTVVEFNVFYDSNIINQIYDNNIFDKFIYFEDNTHYITQEEFINKKYDNNIFNNKSKFVKGKLNYEQNTILTKKGHKIKSHIIKSIFYINKINIKYQRENT